MNVEKVSRRDFLKFTGKTGGGLVLGASAFGVPASALAAAPFPISPETPKDALAMNLFVQIGTDDLVYIVAHRSEMGQGSRTGLPQIVADELDADWEKVRIVQGQGNAVYGSQNTDGSRSVRDFYEPMREMGAAAQWMLRSAAAKKWGVEVNECKVKNHRVTYKKKSLSFGELAEAAAKIPVPEGKTLTYKKPKDFRYIGKPVDIIDLKKMASGDTVFGMDVTLPNMVYASIEHCPYLGGGLKSLDDSEAKKVPGVLDVVKIDHRPLPAIFHPLPGVAVVATNTWAAFEGRKKLAIEWEKTEHQQHNSDEYNAELLRSLNNGEVKVARKVGDIEKGFKEAKDTHSATYTVPYLVHAPMEAPAAAAITKSDGVEVWASTQTPQAAQKELANRFGFKPEQVKVNVTLLGGGFGRKSKPDFIVEAAEISKALNGRPVRLMWTREDEIQMAYYHAVSALKLEAGLDENNELTAWRGRACYPSISSTWNHQADHPSSFELELGYINTPFDIPNQQVETTPIRAHTRIGWLRSVCNIQQAFAVGSFVDELAEKTKTDTVDLWMSLIGKDRAMDYSNQGFEISNYGKSMDDYPFETDRLKNVLKLVAKKSGWGKKTRKNEGWGIACHYSFLSHIAVATKVRLENNKVDVLEVHIGSDCGLAVNPDRVASQMEGSVIFGLSAALMGEITFKDGMVEQSNFDDYPVLRMSQSPEIFVHLVENDTKPRGVGEPGVPPVAPSLTNAIVAAGGKRIRDLPVNKIYQV